MSVHAPMQCYMKAKLTGGKHYSKTHKLRLRTWACSSHRDLFLPQRRRKQVRMTMVTGQHQTYQKAVSQSSLVSESDPERGLVDSQVGEGLEGACVEEGHWDEEKEEEEERKRNANKTGYSERKGHRSHDGYKPLTLHCSEFRNFFTQNFHNLELLEFGIQNMQDSYLLVFGFSFLKFRRCVNAYSIR